MTTNNETERMNQTIESDTPGRKTVVRFIEELYGIRLAREMNPDPDTVQYKSPLSTYYLARNIAQENHTKLLPTDMNRRHNQGCMLFLLNHYTTVTNSDYIFCKKTNHDNLVLRNDFGDEIELSKV